MLTKDDLARIEPKRQPIPEKFSENLYRFCRKELRMMHRELVAHDHTNADGTRRYLGWEFDGELIGSSLQAILHDSARAKVYSYSMRSEPVADFWDHYFRLGKCWLDPEHRFYDARWKDVRWKDIPVGLRPVERKCLWCGLRQVRECYTVTVERERWIVASTEVST